MTTAAKAMVAAVLVVAAAFYFARYISTKVASVPTTPTGVVASTSTADTAGSASASTTMSIDALKNATYGDAKMEGGIATIVSPRGGSLKTVLTYADSVFGDFDADALPDAAVIVVRENAAGSVSRELHLFLNRGGTPQWTGSADLGDRVEWKNMRITAGAVRADLGGSGSSLSADSQVFTPHVFIMKNGFLVDEASVTATTTATN